MCAYYNYQHVVLLLLVVVVVVVAVVIVYYVTENFLNKIFVPWIFW